MTQTLTRPHLHSSQLIRTLTELSLVIAVEPGQGFAEDLSLWVDFNHAITLRSVLSAGALDSANSSAAPTAPRLERGTLPSEALARLRGELASAMDVAGLRRLAHTQALQCAEAGEPLDVDAAFEPYRRHHVAQQRDMAVKIRALREQVRTALAQMSPALKTLAELDAAFDAVLREREDKLFAGVPLMLAQRFAHLFHNHQQALACPPCADQPATWAKPGGWLARLCDELQAVLLAELDVRLQPVLGLVAALENTTSQKNRD